VDNDETEIPTLYSLFGINALLLITGSSMMLYYREVTGFHTFFSLVTFALLFVNIRYIAGIDAPPAAYYMGARFTAFLIVFLASVEAGGYTYSVACFVLAITGIVAGFILKKKELRLYSLILSLVCVVKLVMIDISYDNTAGHAFSFIVSGILCFVISMIYQAADKRLGNEAAPSDSSPESMWDDDIRG